MKPPGVAEIDQVVEELLERIEECKRAIEKAYEIRDVLTREGKP